MSLEQLEEKVGMFGKRDIPGFSAYTKSKALLDAFVKENSGKASPLLKKQYDTKFQMMSADRKTYIANLKKKVGEKPAQEAPKVKEPKKEEPKGDTAGELKSFLEKNKSHYASFLSPKRFSTSLNNDVLTIKPASGTFTIKVDTKNKTVETTGKPDFKSESTSYVEMMEGIKNRTKIKPENITDLSKTNKEEPKKEDDDSRKGSQENFIDEFISARVKENFKKKGMNVKKTLTNLAEFMDNNARAYKLANAGEFFNSDKVYTNFMRREGLARLRGGIQRDIHEFSRKYGDNLRNANS